MKKQHRGEYEPRKQRRLQRGLEAAHEQHGTWDTNLFGKPARICQAFARVIPKEARTVDLGAGVGRHVRALREMGYDVTGMDGTPGIEEITDGLILEVDLTSSKECRPYFRKFEWGICWGVGEHVPADLDPMFFDNIMTMVTEGMIVAWATPDTPGKGHINCKEWEDVAHEFDRAGWVYNEELTQIIMTGFGRKKPTAGVFLD